MRPITVGMRSDTTISTVDGSERRSTASLTHGDASSRARQASRSVHIRFWPCSPSTARTMVVARHALVALHHDPIDLQHPGMRDHFDAAVERQRRDRDDDGRRPAAAERRPATGRACAPA